MHSTGRNEMSAPRAGPRPGVVDRVVALLGAFDAAGPRLSLAELSRRAGMPKPTVHRMAQDLVRHRLLEQDPESREYQLGMGLFELGELVARPRDLAEFAGPIMEDLREATRLRVHLAVLEGTDVVYVRIVGASGARVTSRVGGRLPAHATGVGKAILAYAPPEAVGAVIATGLPRLTPRTVATPGALARDLSAIQETGTAYDREESHLGVSCVAAPVFGRGKAVLAGLSVTGPTKDVDPVRLGIAVRTAAFTLGRELRG
ncbi:MAG: IclR family transcriptional regulator [Dermatophilus congolensis]|nr:IclR family transcriptional regulator [Dermatophilus congolensis]